MIDIIILSDAKNQEFRKLTQNCLDSLAVSEKEIEFNIIVIESNPSVFYENAITIHIKQHFNYNKFANVGIKKSNSKYVCVCNNDIIFHEGWASNLLEAGFESMSPKNRNHIPHFGYNSIHQGYRTDVHICGWCLFFKREIWNTIGGLDEDFEFWCADDSYGAQLKKHNIPHYLVATSFVTHIGQKTINTIPKTEIRKLTTLQLEKFKVKYGEYLGRVSNIDKKIKKKNWFAKIIHILK